MPVPSTINDISPTVADNGPGGGEAVFPNLDNYLRACLGFIAQLRDGTGFAAGAVGTADIEDGILTADAAGRLKMADGYIERAKLSTALQQALTPAGAVMAFAMSAPPAGWLKCDGVAVSRVTYWDLDAAIYCGDANNATAEWGYRCTNPAIPSSTRNTAGVYLVLPDLRGEFVRGLDQGRGADLGRSLWSTQSSQNLSHNHSGTTSTNGAHSHGGSVLTSFGGPGSVEEARGDPDWVIGGVSVEGSHSHSFTTSTSGGSEARPRNLALLYCIKY